MKPPHSQHPKIPNARRRFLQFCCHLRRATPQKWSEWTKTDLWSCKFAAAQPHKSKIMNTKNHLNHLKLALIVGSLALPLITQAGPPPTKEHPRYKLIDLGTLGGPEYYLDFSRLPHACSTSKERWSAEWIRPFLIPSASTPTVSSRTRSNGRTVSYAIWGRWRSIPRGISARLFGSMSAG